MYTFSISVLAQALLIISVSGAADHGKYRKKLLLFFAVMGALATMFYLPITPKVYGLAALLAVISNTCFGASFVLLNSFLPLMVRYHPLNSHEDAVPAEHESLISSSTIPEVLGRAEDSNDPSRGFEGHLRVEVTDAGASLTDPDNQISSQRLGLSTKFSSYGLGIGYIAAEIVQICATLIVLLTGSNLLSLRLALFTVGIWWLVFTIPAALWLRPRPGPPLKFEGSQAKRNIYLAHFIHSWRSLFKTFLRATSLKDVTLFLAAWFLMSDAIATVSGTAILFAKTTLGMKPAALAMINVVAVLFGAIGAVGWRKISNYMRWTPSQTIFACTCLLEIIPLYGLLGYVPAVKRLGVFGLQQPWELYPLGAIYGLCLGGLSSYCRSVFGELIPPGSEAAFYALYAISDKGSSVFGPAIVGVITDTYGDIRPVSRKFSPSSVRTQSLTPTGILVLGCSCSSHGPIPILLGCRSRTISCHLYFPYYGYIPDQRSRG